MKFRVYATYNHFVTLTLDVEAESEEAARDKLEHITNHTGTVPFNWEALKAHGIECHSEELDNEFVEIDGVETPE